MKSNKDKGNFLEKRLSRFIFTSVIIFSLFVFLFFIGDCFDLAEKSKIHFRFDWAATICAFLSAISSILLAYVSVVQNKRAEKANKQLAKINQDQFEISIINNNYPMVKFCDLQRIESNNKKFVIRIYDIRNIPLKEVITKNISLLPLEERFKAGPENGRVALRKEKLKQALQFTFLNDGSNDGFYMINVDNASELFNGYRFGRLELEMDLISTTGIVSRYKGYALLDINSNYNGMPGREYPHVYHQFFEIKEIMSEQKYKNSKG